MISPSKSCTCTNQIRQSEPSWHGTACAWKKHARRRDSGFYGFADRSVEQARLRTGFQPGHRKRNAPPGRAQQFAIMQLDLDRFKEISDNFGHAAGDAMLEARCRVLRQETRSDDSIARIGGDEFLVLLPGLQAKQRCINWVAVSSRRSNNRSGTKSTFVAPRPVLARSCPTAIRKSPPSRSWPMLTKRSMPPSVTDAPAFACTNRGSAMFEALGRFEARRSCNRVADRSWSISCGLIAPFRLARHPPINSLPTNVPAAS